MSSKLSLPGLPKEILRHFFRHINSNTDAICLALTCQTLYDSYISTGALKHFNFGARIATFNALRQRAVTAEVAWIVLRDSGNGPPGYESDNSDMGEDWDVVLEENYESDESDDSI